LKKTAFFRNDEDTKRKKYRSTFNTMLLSQMKRVENTGISSKHTYIEEFIPRSQLNEFIFLSVQAE